MKIDFGSMGQFAGNTYVITIYEELGRAGSSGLQNLLQVVGGIHRTLSTERISNGLIVALSLTAGAELLSKAAITVDEPGELTAIHDGSSAMAIQILPDGRLQCWMGDYSGYSRDELLIYCFSGPGREQILTPASAMDVPAIPVCHRPSRCRISVI